MNTILLATEIVSRVQHSPDSAINLATMVSHMIEQEIQGDACEEHRERMERLRVAYGGNDERLRREFDRVFMPK